jgi:F-box protein 9
VQEKYKAKHLPAQTHGKAPQSQAPVTIVQQSLSTLSQSVSDLINDFADLDIIGQEPPTELSPEPPCPISKIPDEMLLEILLTLAVIDVASYARLAQVCKRLAYLVFKEDRIWRRIALGHEHGFAAMHYSFACSIEGSFLSQGGGLINSVDLLETPYQAPFC